MRIQLELNEKGTQLLGEIRAAIGETEGSRMSHRELFDYAITFLHWGIKERQKNRIIASMDEQEKNYRELIMPILTWVVPMAQPAPAVNMVGQGQAVAAAAGGVMASAPASAATKASAAAAGKEV